MRLERLEISGFKSFSDRAELAFDRGVTAIVGPNGCGKSNVADAITWVLGEQSAKSLRGEKMEDVIFNGSDARKPARPPKCACGSAVCRAAEGPGRFGAGAMPAAKCSRNSGRAGDGDGSGHGNGNGHGNGHHAEHAPSSRR